MENHPTQVSDYRIGLVKEMVPTDQSDEVQIPHNRTRSSPQVVLFSTMGLAPPVKDLGAQIDNFVSPAAHCTEAANNAIR